MSEITCSCCGSIIDGENFYEVEDSVICSDCYNNRTFTCDCCGERYFEDNDYGDDGTALCRNCYENEYHRCERCDRLIHDDDTNWHGDYPYCQSCYDDICDDFINEYSYKPDPIFHHCPDEKKIRYYGVELEIDKGGKADFETIGKMSDQVNGSFVFTILTNEEKLYISKWNNPICLLHFQKLGIYVYTSTKEIMQMALRGTIFEKQTVDVIPVSEGEVISIDKNGVIKRSRFTPEYDDFFGYYGCRTFRERDDYDSYLCEYGNMFGVSNEEIIMLYEMGYEDEDIELMMMDHDMLRDCLNEAKECVDIHI